MIFTLQRDGMDGTNVEGDAAIIWRQAGREG